MRIAAIVYIDMQGIRYGRRHMLSHKERVKFYQCVVVGRSIGVERLASIPRGPTIHLAW
jgi:hypothetical protein